jgi:hypothetical protein
MRFPFELRLRSLARPLAIAGCALAISGPAPRAAAEEPAPPRPPLHEQALDLLVFRPLGTARVVGGALLWVPISLIQTFMDVNKMLFDLPGPPPRPGEPELVKTFDVFVREPAHDVFTRPLGQGIEDI